MSLLIIETEDFFLCISKFIQVVSFINTADLEQHRFELHRSIYTQIFLSTVNTTVQQNLRLVESSEMEGLLYKQIFNCLEGWRSSLPYCSRVNCSWKNAICRVPAPALQNRTVSQTWHCWRFEPDNSSLLGAVLCIVGCLTASLASTPPHVSRIPRSVTTKNISGHYQKTPVVARFSQTLPNISGSGWEPLEYREWT